MFVIILARHSLYRIRYLLHMFQLHGYKTAEFREWTHQNFSAKVITPEHVLFNLVILSLLYFLSDSLTPSAATIILAVFVLFWFFPAGKYRLEQEKKKLVFTPRMKRLAATLALLILPFWYGTIELGYTGTISSIVSVRQIDNLFLAADPYILAFGFVVADIAIPFLLFLASYLMKPIEIQIQKGFKKKARQKLAMLPSLRVIAITGSYGKTSTKFILNAMLRERYKVCVTPGSYNTPMGICKVINDDLQAHHQILILEMGARYPGNIKELCDIAKPDMSIITNVGVSHLETFGSREVLIYEKATLARELKTGGVLVLNGDDEQVSEMSKLRNDIKVIKTGSNGSVVYENIRYDHEGTTVDLKFGRNGESEKVEIKTELLGKHNVQNIVIAAAAAFELGIRPHTMALALRSLKPVEHRLELRKEGGLFIIDDAFNSNPVGAENAVEILSGFKTGRKIIVTPGMIELGSLQESVNRKFGEQIAHANLDLVILVGKTQTKAIQDGIQSAANGSSTEVKIVNSLFEANDILKSYARPGDVVLYENDLPDSFNEY
ncbi:MAG: UDP-N-acetylmuramoyl-tripeptide--D-alanyl-D-alanine ligase [Balneolaceae bacterium]